MIPLTLSEISRALSARLYLPEGREDTAVTSISTDTRTLRAGDLYFALKGERFDAHDFIPGLEDTVAGVVCERLVREDLPALIVEDTTRALGDLGRLCREKCAPRVRVGITGSVGKTTTKEMVGRVLKEAMKVHATAGNFNNAIGLPLTLIGLAADEEALVSEMGMSDFGEISYLTRLAAPNIALVTNIGTSHIEKLKTREGIRDAKLEIIEGMQAGDTLLLNGDEPLLRSETVREKTAHLKVLYVGFDRENDIYPTDIYRGRTSLSFDIVSPFAPETRVTIPVIGDHFVLNALFAAAVGQLVGASPEAICRGLASYEPQGLRQKIYEKGEVTVIADCYNAGPESMAAALKVLSGFPGRRIAVLGDMMELGSVARDAHEQVGRRAAECGIDRLYTYGPNARLIAESAREEGFSENGIFSFEEKEALSAALKADLRPGDTVLFKASRRMKLEDIITGSGLGE